MDEVGTSPLNDTETILAEVSTIENVNQDEIDSGMDNNLTVQCHKLNEENSKNENTLNTLEVIKTKTKSNTNTAPAKAFIVGSFRPLCADYKSASSDSEDTEDSESDSSDSSVTFSEDSSDSEVEVVWNKLKAKRGKEKVTVDSTVLPDLELPCIEDLNITVTEDDCVEIGVVSGIIDDLVVVEAYKNTAPLNTATVLFLDKGKRSMGRVMEVLGPVNEPVYAVRFTSSQCIQMSGIVKGLKVFCAPKTTHTSFVFLPDLLKLKGSDASWDGNEEVPTGCEDFSDDEQERRAYQKQNNRNRSEGRARGEPATSGERWPKRPRPPFKTRFQYQPRFASHPRFRSPRLAAPPSFTAVPFNPFSPPPPPFFTPPRQEGSPQYTHPPPYNMAHYAAHPPPVSMPHFATFAPPMVPPPQPQRMPFRFQGGGDGLMGGQRMQGMPPQPPPMRRTFGTNIPPMPGHGPR